MQNEKPSSKIAEELEELLERVPMVESQRDTIKEAILRLKYADD